MIKIFCKLLRPNRHRRLFGIAFLMTLLVLGAVSGLLWVDFCATQRGFDGLSGSVSLQEQTPLHYQLTTRERSFTIDLTALDALARARREAELWTAPRSVRLGARWLTAGRLWLIRHADRQREAQYRANAGLV